MKQQEKQHKTGQFSNANSDADVNGAKQSDPWGTPLVNIENILPLVRKPGQYIGGELNSHNKMWQSASLRFCLIFPDLYEIGMSHQGLQILYHILNNDERFLAHRCYAPDTDMEEQLRLKDIPLFALESRRPLSSFDVLGFTLPYELCYTNILTVLDLAGLPFRSCNRKETHPLIIGGGSCSLNPEPVADFFDAIVLGDGEEVILELGESLLKAKKGGLTRDKTLRQLAGISGIYVPGFFEPTYRDRQFTGIQGKMDKYTGVRRRVLPRLTEKLTAVQPLVPVVKPVHDRLGVEIARGCTRGCRFCQAGMIYRPVRERSVEEIMAGTIQGIENSGFDELALLSLSTGDYSCLPEVLIRLMDRFASDYVSVSMPSMRVGTLTPEIIEQIGRVRKTGFTVAPEAGSDRMRKVINKGITEEDLLATCRDAFSAGWNLIKFYFMIGLPTETMQDVDAIVDLAIKARDAARLQTKVRINVSVATFVPKPHTPFQWQQQLSLDEAQHRLTRLKSLLPRKGFKLKWHDPRVSFMEGVFSRGDRRLSQLIETAWKSGVRLDGWSEHFRLEKWQQAAEQCGIDLDWYLRGRSMDEPLPWDHLHCGVEREFLEEEYHRALKCTYTPDCRNHGCQKCGLCDFKTIMPVVNKSCPGPLAVNTKADPATQEQVSFRYRIHYFRLGDSRFYGHLEMLQLVFRVLRRARLPVLFSSGFNPSPKVSFAQALPVGMESLVEFFDVDLSRPLKDFQATVDLLNREFPETIQSTRIERITKNNRQLDMEADYEIKFPYPLETSVHDRVTSFLQAEEFVVERVRKKKLRQIDVRPLVRGIELMGEGSQITLIHRQGQAGISPFEVLENIFGLTSEQSRISRIKKIAVREVQTV